VCVFFFKFPSQFGEEEYTFKDVTVNIKYVYYVCLQFIVTKFPEDFPRF
jgi:hypothetical protein